MPRINAEYREDAKKKIIAAALEIAAEKSWDAVTMEAIAKKVGVTKGALYSYFENSETLLCAVSVELIQKIRDGFISIFDKDVHIHVVLEKLASFIFEDQKPYASIFIQFVSRLPQDSRFRDQFSRMFDENILLVTEYLARKIDEKQIHPLTDPDSAARAILGVTIGLRITEVVLGKDARKAKQVWIESVELILRLPGDNK
ncbi:TetR/AcrR family transcriptional regulator [Methanospirillum lacunae]|nr:TetR/AcrR family transcriptional regulator [Methanospirillum lacunae]